MTSPSTIAVVIVPGRWLDDWRTALQDAAERAGLVYQEDWGAKEIPLQTQGCLTVVWTDEPCIADHVFVIAPDPADAVAGCGLLYGLADEDAVRLTSRRFSFAAMRVREGARLVRPGPEATDLPILGPVLLPAFDNSTAEPRLAMFNNLPPAAGQPAVWSAGLMWLAGVERTSLNDAPVDLTGRGRVLVFGPYMMLPPGQWRLTVVFDLDIGNAPVGLAFHWGIEGSAVCEEVEIGTSGRYRLHLDHAWIEPGSTQLHVSLPRAAFSGYFKLQTMQCEFIAWRDAPQACIS